VRDVDGWLALRHASSINEATGSAI
jgi:hypothetical protein